MLKCENLSYRYKQNLPWVIKDFSIKVKPNEIVGIKGESGKGKTTLGKILSGYIDATEGSVLINEQFLPEKIYCPVQLVFQHPENSVNPRWKVKKILSEIDGFFPSDELLYNLSINPLWLDRYPHELSGGELQRIAVARILHGNTKYIIADEMTSMLDTITQAQIWNTVLSFSKKNNTGVIVISHDDSLLEKICTRIIEI